MYVMLTNIYVNFKKQLNKATFYVVQKIYTRTKSI